LGRVEIDKMRFVWIALTISVVVATMRVEEGKGEIVDQVEQSIFNSDLTGSRNRRDSGTKYQIENNRSKNKNGEGHKQIKKRNKKKKNGKNKKNKQRNRNESKTAGKRAKKKKDKKKKVEGRNKKWNKGKKLNKRRKGKKAITRKTKKKTFGEKLKKCPANGVPAICLFNAQKVLNYEKFQVTNYLKQAARLRGHKKINTKKAAKKDDFEHAAEHLVFAIGGDMDNPQCGDPKDNSTLTATEFEYIMSNYTQLKNCSAAIDEACTITNQTFNASHEAKIDFCNATQWEFIMNSRACHRLQIQSKNASEICNCWDTQAAAVEAIKAEKCLTKEKQNLITKQKNFCKKVFKHCREMEDHSVHLTYHCMWDHTMHLINQTAKTIHDSVVNNAKAASGNEKLLDFGRT